MSNNSRDIYARHGYSRSTKMLRFIRFFRTASILRSSAVSNRMIIPPPSHHNYGQPTLKVIQSEYLQLPDNSNFVEKFHGELKQFYDECLQEQLEKNYADFEDDPDELIFEIERYIELQIIPKHSVTTKLSELPSTVCIASSLPTVYCRSLGDELVIEKFLDFSRNVRRTLVMNGGHSFIFDIMLQSASVFQNFEERKREIKK